MGAATARRLLLAVPTSLIGVGLAWLLAHPAGPAPASVVRVLAVGLGSTVLGLTALAWIGRGDRRPLVEPARLWQLTAALSGAWAVTEIVLLGLGAADARAGAVSGLSVAQFSEYVTHSSTGRVGVLVVVLVVAISVASAVTYRRESAPSVVPVLVLGALALVVRPITGHMSQQFLGSALDAVHVLAAALWFGGLTALALTVRSRGAWSVWLPRYSTLAWRSVWVLTVTGVIDAVVKLGGVSPFWDTGYGRIVSAKILALAALLALGWWWRRSWLPDAESHRISAEVSARRATVEVVLMAVVLGLAAALATTG
ncbi:copper resistance protein CopD [Rhodococcus triatomae]|uniref:Putative copper resistance protein D n=1 Tax=Rhodococcus triatomae TaxID=300028 RepID=A0A1G8HRD4_9NOCA|nr:CopD family protein [Rhodococcus triatomae]QNG20859.1 copper resistance protein CopD [Rhodococcus triatomae]QNG23226.1 copper resistance protein CopD [Rhodococcus triatomae]SDI09205.1 putative copper resistance protein D [Rhodococcus triatomae]